MTEALIYLASSFWLGAVHAATPGHGKTIAAAYIVGARGRPVDAWILGIFVTLSHTSGIVLVGVLASLGLPGLESARIEVWLKLLTGVLIVVIGLWTLWTQRGLFAHAGAAPASDGAPHRHDDGTALQLHADGSHSHGFGVRHSHDLGTITRRPSLWMLVWLGIAGGLVPDPVALSLLIRALADGKVMVGLIGVFVFSLGFAAVLVAVGIVAAAVGKRLLAWLGGPGAIRLQLGMSALIVGVGAVLTVSAIRQMA
ncbi:MAG TPA: hypothetical protein VF107_15525 [Burkholderiaceae bacterium]